MNKIIFLLGLSFVLPFGLSPKASANVNSSAETNGYELKIKYSINGQTIVSPRVKIKEGATALITQTYKGKKTFFEVKASSTPGANAPIHIDFTVGTMDRHGKKKIESTPKIVTFEAEKAEITEHDENGREIRSVAVVATRKLLN